MAITFEGNPIDGTHEAAHIDVPRLQVRRRQFWGIAGEAEHVSKPGGRSIRIPITLHKEYATFKSLEKAIQKLTEHTGCNGLLKITGGPTKNKMERNFKHCTFMGFTPRGGPLFDASKCLDAGKAGWFQAGDLHFHQLLAEGAAGGNGAILL